ncbi:MAG: peptidoglycan bridge formation glycyltransferase FemA/FemB family protein [Spirochaetales bacterium]|nr:peptidoglycan bridge formation glycyltransferase FemA/FemB family protein [Spirochaetales bacterium]
MYTVETLYNENIGYEDFLMTHKYSMVYYTLKYIKMMAAIIKDCEYCVIIVKEKDKIIGSLPLIIKLNEVYGNVINSLPFFGSIGGIIVDQNLKKGEIKEVFKLLLAQFYSLEKKYDCISSNIICPPLLENEYEYDFINYSYKEKRLAQILFLPDNNNDARDCLFYNFFSDSLRRNIRKAEKSNIEVREVSSWADIESFYDIHCENMHAINGKQKPKRLFEYIYNNFDYRKDYRILLAIKNNEIISGLLLLYFNNFVEYYTPAIKLAYRNLQPNCILIYKSILDAIDDGYKYYNFGGTWETQNSLYNFKKKWGTKDIEYQYIVKLNRDIKYFQKIPKESFNKEYPFFYILPFDKLIE